MKKPTAKTIWKFVLAIGSVNIRMPKGAHVISVQFQGAELCLWAIVDQLADDRETRTFEVAGTGHSVDLDKCGYIATVQQPPFVWHIFERINP